MNLNIFVLRNCALFLLFAMSLGAPLPVSAQTTIFTYQGKLSDGGSAANGQYDLQFNLYDQAAGVNPPLNGAPVELGDVQVTNGVFTVQLNFGGAFNAGADRFLEIGVRPGASTGAYTILNPRQQITASPYAIRTLSAAQADNADRLGSVPASDYLRTNGDGANVTNLNGANVADNTITGAKIANGEIVRSVNGIRDNLTIAAGTNVTITSNGQIVTVDSNAPVGVRNIYGDGSAGNFTVLSTDPLRNLAAGYGSLQNGANLQFNNVQIDGTLIVPSGFVLRATGNVTVGQSGVIAVNPMRINPGEFAPAGYSMTGAVRFLGGIAGDAGRAAFLARIPIAGGGSGVRPVDSVSALGGEGGGTLAIYAKGSITINGLIDVMGRNAQVAIGTTALPGGGGGGGGIFAAVSRGTITLGTNGRIAASGGNGANGAAGATGVMYGGGGGGGGGVILIISPVSPVIPNPANVIVTGGAAGNSAVTGTATTLGAAGGGGGAGGGNGGGGTRATATSGASQAGNNGVFIAITAANPENLVP